MHVVDREASKWRQGEDVCKGQHMQKERKGRCMKVRKGGQVGEGGGDGWWKEKLRLKSEWRERKGKQRSWRNWDLHSTERWTKDIRGTAGAIRAKYGTVACNNYKGQYLTNWKMFEIQIHSEKREKAGCKYEQNIQFKRGRGKNVQWRAEV